MGAIVKEETLSRSYKQSLEEVKLFDWACANIQAVHFEYAAVKTTGEQSSLEQRFALSCTIPGTRTLHSFVPLSDSTVQVKHYSTSDISRKE